MQLLDYNLEKILDFIQEHLEYSDRELIKKYIRDHDKYGTFDYAVAINGNIVAVCRWNICNDGTVADVLDFAIRNEYRNKGIIQDFIIRALNRFPDMKKIRFQRSIRNDEKFRILDIHRLLIKRSLYESAKG